LSYCGEKMSKSLGNLVFAKDLLGSYEPAAIRLALMHYHYRVGGEWLPELLDEATVVLKRLRTLAPKVSRTTAEGLLAAIRSGLADDLDMHAINHALNDLCLHAETQPTDHDGDAAFQVSLQLLGLG
jgi:L-cysteine:1D-myo-inositol 2-amino-2-deoxy-alpha-D-glucopyranoside ligase